MRERLLRVALLYMYSLASGLACATYFLSSTAARAAARRAMGTRKGEQLT